MTLSRKSIVRKPTLQTTNFLVELDNAIYSLKQGKAACEDGIPIKLIKGIGNQSRAIMLQLFNKICDSGKHLLHSTFVAIPKKN